MEAKLKVYTGNANFNGRRYGVLFNKGVGEATEKQARVLVKNWGYKCPELEAAKSEAVNPKGEVIAPKTEAANDASNGAGLKGDANKPNTLKK